MSKRMLIDAAQADEQRVVVLDGDTLVEADFFSAAKAQIKGNVYLARITRVEPSLQAAFVDFGNGRHGFLPFSEIHPDYFQIPVADREALLEDVQEALTKRQVALEKAEEEAEAKASSQDEVEVSEYDADTDAEEAPKPKARSRRKPKAAKEETAEDAVEAAPEAEAVAEEEEKPKKRRSPRKKKIDSDAEAGEASAESAPVEAEEEKPKKRRSPRKKKAEADAEGSEATEEPAADEEKPKKATRSRKKSVAAAVEEEVVYADDTPTEAAEQSNEGDSAADDSGGEAPKSRSRSRSRRGSGRGNNGGNSSGNDRGDRGRGRPQRRRDDELDELSDAEFESRTMTRAILQKKYRIQEVIKRNQVVLVQVAKEERGEKGAALTTYLSLPGRYCVLMPNTHRGGGISRRIASASGRKRLKSVLDELDIAPSMSLIVRTAGAERTKQEIKRDFAYLTRTWDEIRETTLNSFAPTMIYEEASLIKSAIRDIYESDTSEVLVEGAEAQKAAKAFMKTLTPSHAARVKLYDDETPLFQKHGVEGMLESLNAPQVRLPSGGYLVFNQTEALVAVDVNSGKATRERNIEETALRTNVEAARECARQLRLRDLAGLVVIDFIDMEEHKNVTAVERALKEALKPDRARIQVGRISQFGLMELSRQRLRPSVAEATMVTCPTCHGTGFVKSDAVNARGIVRQVELALSQGNAGQVRIIAGAPLALKLANTQRENLSRLEATFGTEIEIVIDSAMGPTHFRCVLDRDGRHEAFGTEGDGPREPKSKGRNRGRGRGEPRNEPKEESVAEEARSDDDEEGDRKRRRRGKRGGRGRGKRDEATEARA